MNKQDIIIYTSSDGQASVALYARDGVVWLNQNQLAELFATSKSTLSEHISNILKDNELIENSVVRNFRTTATDGKEYSVQHYALPMILAIGFRIRSHRGIQFRQWANQHLREYMTKGFVMDDERLKNPITMDFWRENTDRIIAMNDKVLLSGKGSVSNQQMQAIIELDGLVDFIIDPFGSTVTVDQYTNKSEYKYIRGSFRVHCVSASRKPQCG